MKKSPLALLIFLLTLFIAECSAQTRQLKFDKITGTKGVSLGTINAITQDKFGFIWFSDETGQCITRYDGSSMKRYKNDPSNSNSLGGYYPECLFADSTGVLWIGFYGQGLDRFDPVSETFTHFRNDPKDPGSLSHDYVSAVRVDHLGNVWVGTNSGLDLLDQASGKFAHHKHTEGDSTSLSYDEVRAIYEDHEGTLWVGTGFGNNKGGLNRLNRNTNTFTQYLHDPENPHSLINNSVRAIFEDSKGNFWIGTSGDGLHTMDRKTGRFTRHLYDPNHPEKLSRPPVDSQFNLITFIAEDTQQNIWIGSVSNGVNRYDPVTKKVTHFGNNTDDSGTFIENNSWWIYVARDGLIWLSTQPGLYHVDPDYVIVPRINKSLNILFQESPTISWIGTGNGLIREDLQYGTSTTFLHDANPTSISNNRIRVIFKDRKGMIWVGTEYGLNQYDPVTNLFIHYMDESNNNPGVNVITAINEDPDSNLWIGTGGGGLKKLDQETGTFTHYKSDLAASDIGEMFVGTITEYDSATFLVSYSNSVYKVNWKNGQFTPFLSGYRVNDLYKDKDEVTWIGTEQGLYQLKKGSDKVSSIMNDVVYSIIGDVDNNLWISSSPGFVKINKTRNQIIHYSNESKTTSGFYFGNIGRAYQKPDGQIMLGEFYGYYAFYPDKLITSSAVSRVYITDFWLNGKPVQPGSNQVLKQSLYETKSIHLNHDQNIFSFTITEIDFRNMGDDVINYILENYDEDWREASSGEKANYSKVPPGKYIFRIKAINSGSGLAAEKSIAVTILPPWWTTWWAYSVYGILFIGGVFIADRFQRKRLLERAKAEAKEKELEQSREIEKAYMQLKATQSQLIQSEKMASLGELTAGIAHEIQNPLNFVNNFSEVNTELIKEIQDERRKTQDQRDEKLEDELLQDIVQNQEKINHHGKRAADIVKGMLQHSRSSSGVKEPTNINALADEYLRLAYHGLRAKDKSFNATMKTDFDETIGNINIIPQDIGRVILNLINNAFYVVNEKAHQNIAGYEPTVSVSTKKEGNKVLISVKDNGNGIPQKILDKIFQPFFTTKPTGQGTGLGLSLSYDIVKAHGGELKVESYLNEGSKFTIIIPDTSQK